MSDTKPQIAKTGFTVKAGKVGNMGKDSQGHPEVTKNVISGWQGHQSDGSLTESFESWQTAKTLDL